MSYPIELEPALINYISTTDPWIRQLQDEELRRKSEIKISKMCLQFLSTEDADDRYKCRRVAKFIQSLPVDVIIANTDSVILFLAASKTQSSAALEYLWDEIKLNFVLDKLANEVGFFCSDDPTVYIKNTPWNCQCDGQNIEGAPISL